MYYRLNDDLLLRGWEKRTGNLVHKKALQILPLHTEAFRLLLLCDGETDITEDMLTEIWKEKLEEAEKAGVISRSTEPKPISSEQHYRYYDNRCVNSVMWSMTGRCNFRCRHCYMDAPDAKLGELSHDEAISLIDQMAECGVVRVNLTGGEPLVRSDFWSLIDHILEKGMGIGQIYTNGWLVDEAFFAELKKRNMKTEISVSFDGLGWHDWMRGVKGAEERAIKALKLAVKHGHPVSVQMCMHKGNLSTLRKTILYLAEIGVRDMRIGGISQTELWKRHSEGKDLAPTEVYDAMLEYIPMFFEDGMPMNLMLSGMVWLKENSTSYQVLPERCCGNESCLNEHLCGAVKAACYITPEGRMLPCMPMTACDDQSAFPLVQDIGLKNGLKESDYLRFVDSRVKDLLAVNEQCNECEYKYKCGGGCRANAMIAGKGGFMDSDPSQCILWKNGYPDKIRSVCDAAIAKYCPEAKKDKQQ